MNAPNTPGERDHSQAMNSAISVPAMPTSSAFALSPGFGHARATAAINAAASRVRPIQGVGGERSG